MSSIEERLVRDIAAVTGGFVVTESDLSNARDAVVDRIEIGRQRSRRRTLAAAAAVAVVLPIVGVVAFNSVGGDESAPPANPAPQSPNPDDAFLTGSAPTPDLLAGIWRVDNGAMLLMFTADGAIKFDDGGRLLSDPGAVGTYEIAGDLITVTVDGGPAGCAGQTFAMRASLPESGAMRFVHTQPGTGNCSPQRVPIDVPLDDLPGPDSGVWWALEQVLPTNSEYLADFDTSQDRGWRPLRSEIALYGDWMAEGGGYLLEIAPDGTYYIASDAGSVDVVDRGFLSQRRSELTLTSSVSYDCNEGDRLVLGGVEHVNSGASVMRGTVDENTCGAPWTPSAWVLLPQ